MKKTYKTFNGENRNCFFKVGKALVKVRFTPTYTTDNEFVQKAIEDSFSFKAGELQLATTVLQWLPIDRDENGFATEECLDEIYKAIPFVVATRIQQRSVYLLIQGKRDFTIYKETIYSGSDVTHYLPIPKLEV